MKRGMIELMVLSAFFSRVLSPTSWRRTRPPILPQARQILCRPNLFLLHRHQGPLSQSSRTKFFRACKAMSSAGSPPSPRGIAWLPLPRENPSELISPSDTGCSIVVPRLRVGYALLPPSSAGVGTLLVWMRR